MFAVQMTTTETRQHDYDNFKIELKLGNYSMCIVVVCVRVREQYAI